jgi:ketosteroid isomerase-like protein
MRKLLFVPLLIVAGSAFASDAISEAKAVVASNEQSAMAGDLNGVMSNAADDIVVLTYGVPLIEGKDAFREFYAGLLATGDMVFGHDYTGEDAIGSDVVVLRGVSRGTVTTSEGAVTKFSNNFIHILRRGDDGKFRFWRATFAPDALAPMTGE